MRTMTDCIPKIQGSNSITNKTNFMNIIWTEFLNRI
jgi:hypothetical protein